MAAHAAFSIKFSQTTVSEAAPLRWLASHVVRNMRREPYRFPTVTKVVYDDILTRKLPTPQEQADNLIVWLGQQLDGTPVGRVRERVDVIGAIIGTRGEDWSERNVEYVANYLRSKDLITLGWDSGGDPPPRMGIGLTFAGWARYYALERTVTQSRNAFMAMQFNDPAVDGVYKECFVTAVTQTGFSLRRLDEKPEAGLIDNRLRVEIRAAAFLIADLTHRNAGAYWEAGYAEGLGKPVIYTCSRPAFEDAGTRPHFDVNHHTTIIWDADDLTEAAEQLKATIRNTLPAAAKMQDN
jgi:hypothetical protein